MSVPPRAPSGSDRHMPPSSSASSTGIGITVGSSEASSRLQPKLPIDQANAAFIEKKKNEIVNAMLIKIKPFVGSNGFIQPDVDFDRLGKVMEGESEFMGRTLILTILLSSTAEPRTGGEEARAMVFLLTERLTRSAAMLSVLQKWLSDAAKASEPDCHLGLKIMELLGRLNLTVDQLLQYKYGRQVKKILGREDCIDVETKKKAQQLYDKWSDLAKSEEGKRRSSSESVPARKSSASESAGPVENMQLFSEASAPKTRAAMILERSANQATTRPVVPSSRPMSADEIHKAKKRRQYLQEAVASGTASPEEVEQLGLLLEKPTSPPPPPPSLLGPNPGRESNDINTVDLMMSEEGAGEDAVVYSEISPRTGRPKKRVSFANEEELVQIHYFEAGEEMQTAQQKTSLSSFRSKRKSSDYHHADKSEASYAFNRLRMEMEAEIEWRTPLDIDITDENIAPARGEESVDRGIQEQRERQAVSAVYFSNEHVPPSPSETEPTLFETASREPVRIPEGAANVQPQKVNILDPKAVDPKMLSAILQGINAPPRPPIGLPFPPHMLPPRPPMFPPPPFPLPGAQQSPAFHPFPVPGGPQTSAFPPFHPPAAQQFSRPPLPFPFFMPPAGAPRPSMVPGGFPPMPLPGQRPPFNNFKTKLCKFYKPGQPGSCRFGASCSFLHQDY